MISNDKTDIKSVMNYRGVQEEALKCSFNASVAIFKQVKALAIKVEAMAIEHSQSNKDLQDFIKEIPHNRISLTPQRLQQYIRQSGKAEFNKSVKEWIPQIKPKIRL